MAPTENEESIANLRFDGRLSPSKPKYSYLTMRRYTN